MAPTTDAEEKRKELKAKLAAKTNGSHKATKDTKAQVKAKEQADKDAKEKAAAEVKAKAEKVAAAKAKAAAVPPPPPSVWADEKDEASQLGIHLGISCDGCGHTPPLIGKAMKCKDCPDFDLCDKCYPERLDKGREAVAAAAGMPGKGRHPKGHCFGPRKAAVVMTAEACAAEIAAAEETDKKSSERAELLKTRAEARRQREADGTAGTAEVPVFEEVANLAARLSECSTAPDNSIWRPSTRNAALCPTPNRLPRVLRPA